MQLSALYRLGERKQRCTVVGVGVGPDVVDTRWLGAEGEGRHADLRVINGQLWLGLEESQRLTESRKEGVETLRTWSTDATMVAERTGSYMSQNRFTQSLHTISSMPARREQRKKDTLKVLTHMADSTSETSPWGGYFMRTMLLRLGREVNPHLLGNLARHIVADVAPRPRDARLVVRRGESEDDDEPSPSSPKKGDKLFERPRE